MQVELSPWHDDSLRNGVAELLPRRKGSRSSPIGRSAARQARGGWRGIPVLAAVAARHGATPAEVALAWLRGLAPRAGAAAGPTRPEHAAVAGARRARCGSPTEDVARELDARFPRRPAAARAPGRAPAAATRRGGEVVLVMGLPGAGKSTLAARPRRAGLRAAEPRRGGRPPGRSAARPRARCSRPAPARRARQHLRLARRAQRGDRGRLGARRARALRLAPDEPRGRAGERRASACCPALRPPARARRAEGRRARRTRARSPPRRCSATGASSSRPTTSEGFARVDTVPFQRRRARRLRGTARSSSGSTASTEPPALLAASPATSSSARHRRRGMAGPRPVLAARDRARAP